MRIVIQRVSSATVTVDGSVVSAIERGLCLLVGVAVGDTFEDVDAAVAKIANLRVFADAEGRMNRSALESGNSVLVVSQFTVMGDVRRGRRPSFTDSESPERAAPLVARMVDGFSELGLTTAQGVFGAKMEVALVNDGPVTLVVDINSGSVV
jgi:D-tyrosyl-tRNA(Tyr) deacylase